MRTSRLSTRFALLAGSVAAILGSAAVAWACPSNCQDAADCASGPNQLCRTVTTCVDQNGQHVCATDYYYYT